MDTPDRREIHEEAKRVKESKQTPTKKRGEDGKDVLEIDDICTLVLEGNVKTPFPYLSCMINSVTTSGNSVRYNIYTSDGHLRGTFNRNQLNHRPTYNAQILSIDTSVENFKINITVQEACNHDGNEVSCGCKEDCSTSSRCFCKAAKVICTTKRHGGRGKNNYTEIN
jgi:hypothetical protein